MTTNPRTIATAARGTVIIGSGLALGFLTAHVATQAVLQADAKQATKAAATSGKPKVVTVHRVKHVKSDPIVVYRGGSTPSSNSGSGNSGVASAPQAPQAAPAKKPAAKSSAS